jgi:hypothetical protein
VNGEWKTFLFNKEFLLIINKNILTIAY